ncbi:MAG: hypothetical protein GWP06_14235 [Actinobacteria bacterium]|nr:hypothetical protein [Actinomycetota bacterium]
MFRETVVLTRPVKMVTWVEEELGQSKSPVMVSDHANKKTRQSAGDHFFGKGISPQKAEQIAAEQLQLLQLEKIRQLFETFNQSIEMHFGMVEKRMKTVESNVITLALAVAQKVIDKELDVNPNIVRATVEKALQRMDEDTNVIVQVNPEDREIIEKYWDEIIKTDSVNGWKLEAKSGIGRGGCVIRSANEIIDATIESQMKLVEQVLAKSVDSPLVKKEGSVQV